jgi:hypothetical protein
MKRNNTLSTKVQIEHEPEKHIVRTHLTNAERILAVLFGFGFILGFILTPLGVETRMPELRTLAFAGFFITVGLLIPLAGLVSVWLRKPRLAGILAAIDAALLFLTAPADQALFFSTVSPLPGVTAGEYILIFVGIVYMLMDHESMPINKHRMQTLSRTERIAQLEI